MKLFLSIHCNASTNASANGTEVYTFNTAIPSTGSCIKS